MEVIYNKKGYSLEELHQDHLNFIDKLELPNDFIIKGFTKEFVWLQDIGYGIAIDKYLELYHMVTSARFALINAHQKFYDTNIISRESGYIGQLWMRSEYLKNSMIWYNCCEDYIYQIIWFAYELFSEPLKSKELFKKALRECSYNAIKDILNGINDINAKKLLKKMKDYRYDKDVKYLRSNLANNLKHRGNINIKGIEDKRSMGFVDKNSDGSEKFNIEWIEPEKIDIDETIEIISRVHIKLISYGRDILDFLDIDNMFAKDLSGNKILNVRTNKLSYKKIVFK